MRRIRQMNENGVVSTEKVPIPPKKTIYFLLKGESMARLLGTDCEFVSTSFCQFDGATQLLEKMIRKIRQQTDSAPTPKRR
jgi:hypothetical protein